MQGAALEARTSAKAKWVLCDDKQRATGCERDGCVFVCVLSEAGLYVMAPLSHHAAFLLSLLIQEFAKLCARQSTMPSA